MYAPVRRMTKAQIIWLMEHKCRHAHAYLTHYNCYLEETGHKEKVACFDIESTNLSATFGYVFAYCLKELDGPLIKRCITGKDIRSGNFDRDLMIQFNKDAKQYDRLITYYGCVTPGHKVLTADLQWVPVESLEEGDGILGFDEEPRGLNLRRKFKSASVVHAIPIKKRCSEIILSNGQILVATNDHPWLVQRSAIWCWKKTSELMHFNGKNSFQAIMPVWDTKLDTQFDVDRLGQVQAYGPELTVVAINDVGEKEVIGLETTSKTYIVNGYGSHNTKFDIPFMRTRALHHKVAFPLYKTVQHSDVYNLVKYKLKLHRSRLETACQFFNIPSKGHRLNPEVWNKAMCGDKESLDYIVQHCSEDVESLEALYKILQPFASVGRASL